MMEVVPVVANIDVFVVVVDDDDDASFVLSLS